MARTCLTVDVSTRSSLISDESKVTKTANQVILGSAFSISFKFSCNISKLGLILFKMHAIRPEVWTDNSWELLSVAIPFSSDFSAVCECKPFKSKTANFELFVPLGNGLSSSELYECFPLCDRKKTD